VLPAYNFPERYAICEILGTRPIRASETMLLTRICSRIKEELSPKFGQIAPSLQFLLPEGYSETQTVLDRLLYRKWYPFLASILGKRSTGKGKRQTTIFSPEKK
jgi:hypothetical protein